MSGEGGVTAPEFVDIVDVDVDIDGDEVEEPFAVAFHEEIEHATDAGTDTDTTAAAPAAQQRPSATTAENVATAANEPATPLVVEAPQHTVKNVDITSAAATATVLTTIRPPITVPPTTSFAAPSPSQALSPYAVSLLSSGAIFRSYSLNLITNQVEFQDIKLYATFPNTTASAHSEGVPLLHWGPPQQRTSQPAPFTMPILSITDIYRGKKSLLFQSHSPLIALLASSRCFTVHTESLSLNLEAMTQQVRDEWITRIIEIARVYGHRSVRYSTLNEEEENEEDRRKLEQFAKMRQASKITNNNSTSSNHLKVNNTAEISVSSASSSHLSPNPPSSLTSSDSSLSLTSSSSLFTFRGMKVVTKERTARDKLSLQADMRYTLTQCVASASQYINSHSSVNALAEEFTDIDKNVTKHLPTINHPSNNFEYKAYAGPIFTRLRWLYNLDDRSYLASVASPKGYNDFIANSKSGSFFFYTYDKKYLIKSMTQDEARFLFENVLPSYYHHLTVYRDSLLSKIFGLYRIKRNGTNIYFMLMVNVFYSEKPIHLRFDLKGSTLGRKATEREKLQETPVLKDLDFLQGCELPNNKSLRPFYLKLGLKKSAVVKQLSIDAKYLEQLEIMDYSLLVGVHYRDRAVNEDKQNNRESSQKSSLTRRVKERQQNYGTRKHEIVIPRVVMKQVQRKMEEKGRRQSLQGQAVVGNPNQPQSTITTANTPITVTSNGTGSGSGEMVVHTDNGTVSTAPVAFVRSPSIQPDSTTSDDDDNDVEGDRVIVLDGNDTNANAVSNGDSGETDSDMNTQPSFIRVNSSLVFTEVDGGLASVDPVSGKAGNEIYYLGVIDILQRYTARKKMEHGVKSLTHDAASVSCAPPDIYAKRFLNAITSRMLGVAEDGSAWHSQAMVEEGAGVGGDEALTMNELMASAAAENAARSSHSSSMPVSASPRANTAVITGQSNVGVSTTVNVG